MKKNLVLLKAYLIAGTFTFSGGMAMLPVIERELVTKHHFLSKEELFESSLISQTLPGVIALTNACFVGKKVNGTIGMIFASFGVIFPAYSLMTLASILYTNLPDSSAILAFLTGVRATSASFLFATTFSLGRYSIKNTKDLLFCIFILLLISSQLFSSPIIILLTIIIGFIIGGISKS